MPVLTGASIFREYPVEGVPSVERHKPSKTEIRQWTAWVETMLNAGTITGPWKASLSALNADLAHAAGTVGFVYTTSDIGTYLKSGASGSGSWTKIFDFVPGLQFARASDNGSSANAWVMTTVPQASAGDGVTIIFGFVPATNTSATVTAAIDGGAARSIKTGSNNNPAIGGLVIGMPFIAVVAGSGTTLRLLSDQASAAVLAAAEAAQAAAEAAAALSGPVGVYPGSFVGDGVETTITMPAEPISAAHVLVLFDGAGQHPDTYTVDGTDLMFFEPIPDGVVVSYRILAISEGESVPPDGSVTKIKVAAAAIDETKIDPSAAAAIRTLLALVAGTNVQAYDAQLGLPGSVVQSSHTFYATNAAISTAIPNDDSVPQVGEGTGIISLAITPKSITNKLRIRFKGNGAGNGNINLVAAMFVNGAANAVRVTHGTCHAATYSVPLSMEYEYVPGALTAQTITIRVGPSSGTMRLNGSDSGRLFGGSEAATLTIEEIKA